MSRLGPCIAGCLLLLSTAEAQSPPVLRGQVRHLNGDPVVYSPVRLLEADVEGSTRDDGTFKIQFPAGWDVGRQVTLFVALEGYEVIRPWEGKYTVREGGAAGLEPVVVALRRLANLITNTTELERILLNEAETDLRSRQEPSGSAAITALRDEAQRLDTTPGELVALLEEWRNHAQERGDRYARALAFIYEKQYAAARPLLEEDIAADEQDISRADNLRLLLPRKYLNLGIAYAGEYKHDEAEQAYRKALECDPGLSDANRLSGNTLYFTGHLDAALSHYRRALELERRLNRPEGMAVDLGNIGIVYNSRGALDSALVYYRESLALNRQLDQPEGMAEQLGNIGVVYGMRGALDSALVYYRQALALSRQLDRPAGIGHRFWGTSGTKSIRSASTMTPPYTPSTPCSSIWAAAYATPAAVPTPHTSRPPSTKPPPPTSSSSRPST
jgi:tetratricopeptide (TPR) repeat protein